MAAQWLQRYTGMGGGVGGVFVSACRFSGWLASYMHGKLCVHECTKTPHVLSCAFSCAHTAALTQVKDTVFVFGGTLLRDGTVTNELLWMSTERMEWHLQPTRGDRPAPRHSHCTVYDPDTHQLVIFGGRHAGQGRAGQGSNVIANGRCATASIMTADEEGDCASLHSSGHQWNGA
jgi:Galactose oxidase, central domain